MTATKPANLGATVSFGASTVTVEPLLMNPSDQLSIKVLLRRFDGTVNGDARIVGIRDVKRRYESGALDVARTSTFLSLVLGMVTSLVSALSIDFVKAALPTFLRTVPAFLESVMLPLLLAVLGYYFGRVREFKKPEKDDIESGRES